MKWTVRVSQTEVATETPAERVSEPCAQTGAEAEGRDRLTRDKRMPGARQVVEPRLAHVTQNVAVRPFVRRVPKAVNASIDVDGGEDVIRRPCAHARRCESIVPKVHDNGQLRRET